MRAKETDAISGMHMPSGENLWASPADDEEEEDLTKEALGLTSIPGEMVNDTTADGIPHVMDSDKPGVIDVETVIDVPPMNNAKDSSTEKKMEELLEDLVKQLESRGYADKASLIKGAQQTSVQYSSETHKRAGTAKSVLSNLIQAAGVGSDWEKFISGMITPAGISNGTITFSWLRAWVAVAGLWRDMSNSGLHFDQYKSGAKVSPAQSEWAQVGAALKAWNDRSGPAQAFSQMLQMDKQYGEGMIADTMGSLQEYMKTMPVGNLGSISEDFSSGYSVKLEKAQPKQQQQQQAAKPRYRFADQDDAQRSGVKQVQTALGGISVDGWWGSRTDAAWKAKHGELPSSLEEAIRIATGSAEEAEKPQEAGQAMTGEEGKETSEQLAMEPSRDNIVAAIERLLRGMPMTTPGVDSNVLESGRVRRMTKRYLRGIGSDRTIRSQEDQDKVVGLAASAITQVDIGGKTFEQAVQEGLAGKTGDDARQSFDGLVWQYLQRAWAAYGSLRGKEVSDSKEQRRLRRLDRRTQRQLDRAERRSER